MLPPCIPLRRLRHRRGGRCGGRKSGPAAPGVWHKRPTSDRTPFRATRSAAPPSGGYVLRRCPGQAGRADRVVSPLPGPISCVQLWMNQRTRPLWIIRASGGRYSRAPVVWPYPQSSHGSGVDNSATGSPVRRPELDFTRSASAALPIDVTRRSRTQRPPDGRSLVSTRFRLFGWRCVVGDRIAGRTPAGGAGSAAVGRERSRLVGLCTDREICASVGSRSWMRSLRSPAPPSLSLSSSGSVRRCGPLETCPHNLF